MGPLVLFAAAAASAAPARSAWPSAGVCAARASVASFGSGGSAFMMLTGGIEAAEGKSYPFAERRSGGLGRAGDRRGGLRRRRRHRFVFGLALVPAAGIARYILVENLRLEIGLDHIGVVEQRKGGAALGGAAVAHRQHMRGDAVSGRVRWRGADRRGGLRNRGPRGGQSRARQPAASAAPPYRRPPRRSLRGPANTAFSQAFSTASPAAASRQASAEPGASACAVSCAARCVERAPLGRALVLRQPVEYGRQAEADDDEHRDGH